MFVAVVVIQTFGYSEMFVSYMHLLFSTSYINPHGPKNTSNPILDRPTVNAPFSSYERTPSHVCGTPSSVRPPGHPYRITFVQMAQLSFAY